MQKTTQVKNDIEKTDQAKRRQVSKPETHTKLPVVKFETPEHARR